MHIKIRDTCPRLEPTIAVGTPITATTDSKRTAETEPEERPSIKEAPAASIMSLMAMLRPGSLIKGTSYSRNQSTAQTNTTSSVKGPPDGQLQQQEQNETQGANGVYVQQKEVKRVHSSGGSTSAIEKTANCVEKSAIEAAAGRFGAAVSAAAKEWKCLSSRLTASTVASSGATATTTSIHAAALSDASQHESIGANNLDDSLQPTECDLLEDLIVPCNDDPISNSQENSDLYRYQKLCETNIELNRRLTDLEMSVLKNPVIGKAARQFYSTAAQTMEKMDRLRNLSSEEGVSSERPLQVYHYLKDYLESVKRRLDFPTEPCFPVETEIVGGVLQPTSKIPLYERMDPEVEIVERNSHEDLIYGGENLSPHPYTHNRTDPNCLNSNTLQFESYRSTTL
eukprot:Filipodium_phascolosomae@DN1583_c0_g1_i1.p1